MIVFKGVKFDSVGGLLIKYATASQGAVKWNGFHFDKQTGELYVRAA